MPINKIFIQFYLLIFILFIFPSLAFAFDTSRPGPENIPTKVEIQLYVVDIAGINDGAQSFNASIFIEAKWKDQRLASSNEKQLIILMMSGIQICKLLIEENYFYRFLK